MESVFTLIFLLGAATLAGGAAAWYIRTIQFRSSGGLTAEEAGQLRQRLTDLQQEQAALSERADFLKTEVGRYTSELQQQQETVRQQISEISSLRERNDTLNEKLTSERDQIARLQEQMRKDFEVLANEILDKKSERFVEQNRKNLDSLLNPFGEKLKDFGKLVNETYSKEMAERHSLEKQILALKDMNLQMSEDAKNLVRALKGDSKTQGNWGEVILERILEKSGLTRDREYRIQESVISEDGRRQQPDVVIDLPEGKNLIIDSKISITAYERFASAESDADREAALKQHLTSVRTHVRQLSEKNYQKLYEVSSPDFVLMFIPIEPAFSIAIQHAQEIYMEAFERNIVIVSPSTLLATLATIASIWKQEYRNRNAIEIARQGGALYDKFVGFVSDMDSLGDRLDKTRIQYDEAMKKLKTGRGNLISQATKMQKLGTSNTKQLPEKYLPGDSDEDDIEPDDQNNATP